MSKPTEQGVGEAAPRYVRPIASDGETLFSHFPFFRMSLLPISSALADRVGVLVLIILYLALGIAFSQRMHFSRALDEGYHLEYITFIKQHGRLPISYEERAKITRADFPPLYQLLVTLASARVKVEGPPSFKIFWDSFRYRAIDHQEERVWTLNTEDYQPPYLGEFLVWQIGRWLSILLSLATVLVVFLTLRETPLGQIPLAPLIGAALLAFIPRYLMLGSALNDDNLLGLLAALYFWMLVKAINNPARWQPFMAMGILLGLAMTVKYTLVVAPLEIIAVCIVLARSKKSGWPWALRRIGVVGLLALPGCSWWFGWNIWFLNTVSKDGWVVGLLRPILAGGSDTTLNRISGLVSGGQAGLTDLPEDTIVGTFPQWIQFTFLSFWGGGLDTTPFFLYAYIAVGLMLGAALWGLGRLWQRRISSHQWLALFLFHVGIFFILPLIRFGLTRRLSVAAQGRHLLIPAATAIVALLVWGLATMIPPRWQRPVFGLILLGFISWTGLHLYDFKDSGPIPLPLRTLPQAAEWLPQRVEASFGEAVELVSYDLEPRPEQGLLHLDLAWRSLAYVNESYLFQVMVKNAEGETVAHWSGYNGQGRLPTLTWDPGDAVFDRLVLPLPDLPAGDYTLQVRGVSNAGPLPVTGPGSAEPEPGEASPDHSLLLAHLALKQPTRLPLPNQVDIVGEKLADSIQVNFTLWRTEGPVQEKYPTYRYPATISIITSLENLVLELIDETGQVWPALQSEAGIHTFVIGPRWQSGAYRLRIGWREHDQILGQATTRPLLTVENWWQRRFEAPEMANAAPANFANQIMFLGYKLPQTQVKAGQAFPITIYWQAPPNRSPQASFTQFNTLLDSAGTLRGGYDRQPLEYYDTLLWAPGEVVIDGYAVPVDPEAPPGEYYLNVGYYLTVGESAVNLPLVIDGQPSDVSSVTIGPIEVVAP